MAAGTRTGKSRPKAAIARRARRSRKVRKADRQRSPTLWSGQSLELAVEAGPDRREVAPMRVTASFAAVQTGTILSGVFRVGRDVLPMRGRITERKGVQAVRFAAGPFGDQRMDISFVGVADGPLLDGRFVGGFATGGGTVSGRGRCPDVFRQEASPAPTPKKKEAADCGDRLWGPVERTMRIKGGEVRFRITVFVRCTRVEFLGEDGGVIESVDLDNDTTKEIGKVKIRSYRKKSKGVAVRPGKKKKPDDPPPPPVGHWGSFRCFFVEGCDDPKFFQFVHSYSQLTGTPAADIPANSGWHADGPAGKPYRGTLEAGKMFDGPGVPMESTAPAGSYADGAVWTVTQDFETFVCCGDTLLGYFAWSSVLTQTYSKAAGTWSSAEPSTTDAVWHDPTDSPRANDVHCK